MTAPGTTGRAAVYEAVQILEDSGYYAERVIGIPKIFDIIAWKGGRTICVTVRSSRRAKISAFREYVGALSRMITMGAVPPGDVQFWMYRSPGWNRWRITSGGATPVDQWDVLPLPHEGATA